MKRSPYRKTLLSLCLSAAVLAPVAGASEYRVVVTNLTQAQAFTPILVASHRQGHPLFTLGHSASAELEAVAEGGDTGPLQTRLETNDDVETASSAGLLGPGESVTIDVTAGRKARYLSLISMLIPTNDAFLALNGVKLPRKRGAQMVYWAPAYDAGTEVNDESCAHIPGPVCGGEGFSASGGEGFVYTHSGIHGIADLAEETYDWRNPVARVVVEKMD